MKKGLIAIIIGVLTVVSLILALPVSPLRYSTKGVVNTYVDGVFSKIGIDINGKLNTARQITKSNQYEAFGFDLNSKKKNKIDFSGNYSNINVNNSNGNSTGLLDMKTSNSKLSGIGSESDFSTSTSGNGSNANSSVQKIGFRSTSTTLENGNNKQDVTNKNYGLGQGGTHPGLDPQEQLGNLPLGDGTALMILFSFFFGFFKIRKL